MRSLRAPSVALLVLSCAACGSAAPKPAPAVNSASNAAPSAGSGAGSAAAPARRPWPVELATEAILIADVIHIEGPQGLIEHVAVRQEGDSIAYKAETTAAGFLQVWTPTPGLEVRGQLDNCVLAAMQRLTVLERPGATSVDVRASGHAVYKQITPSGVIEQGGVQWSASYPVPEK
jgi:hypothetical protein